MVSALLTTFLPLLFCLLSSLLFGNGIHNPMARGDFSCLKNINLALPRERRRSITGSNDGIFGGGNVEEVLNQQKETTGYEIAAIDLTVLQMRCQYLTLT